LIEVGSPPVGDALAGVAFEVGRDDAFGREFRERQVGVIGRVQTPAGELVPTFCEAANKIIKRTLSAAAR
jgi:hypothetical protein